MIQVLVKLYKGALMGTPNREPQEYSRNIIGIYLSGSFYSYYTPTIFLGFPLRPLYCSGFHLVEKRCYPMQQDELPPEQARSERA